MPVETPITAADHWIQGRDKDFALTNVETDGVTPQSMTGWTLLFEILDAEDAPTALIAKTPVLSTSAAGTAAGVSDDVATASVADTDSEGLKGNTTYVWRLRRTDAGFEDEYGFGTVYLRARGF